MNGAANAQFHLSHTHTHTHTENTEARVMLVLFYSLYEDRNARTSSSGSRSTTASFEKLSS